MILVPMDLDEAQEFVLNFHRHNKPVVGHKFSLGCSDGDRLVGVAIVGRPVNRNLDDKATLEATRVCVTDAAPKGACSFLYSRCWRAAAALGYSRLITYNLQSESGASLRGAGFRLVGTIPPRAPGGWQNRPGREWQEVVGQAKFRWERSA